MDKIIDFRKTVYELATEHPEFKEIMASVGFKEITEPEILASAGKIMTVPKWTKRRCRRLRPHRRALRQKHRCRRPHSIISRMQSPSVRKR